MTCLTKLYQTIPISSHTPHPPPFSVLHLELVSIVGFAKDDVISNSSSSCSFSSIYSIYSIYPLLPSHLHKHTYVSHKLRSTSLEEKKKKSKDIEMMQGKQKEVEEDPT
ncbi:hypothetical protein ACJQWK_02982 [Exserohilum turcicum]